MENSNEIRRLRTLLDQRKEKLISIRNFDDLFFKFSKRTLRDCVEKINMELYSSTEDQLKIFYDDPYEHRNSKYYVLIQFFAGNDRNEYYLRNVEVNPGLRIEGEEFTGKVIISHKLGSNDKYKDVQSVDIKYLDEDFTLKVVIDFIAKVYNQ